MSDVDVLLVNPPSFERGVVIIRDMDRHGRVSIERTIWPQSTLASIAAHVARLGLSVDLVDCIAVNMEWDELERLLRRRRPRANPGPRGSHPSASGRPARSHRAGAVDDARRTATLRRERRRAGARRVETSPRSRNGSPDGAAIDV